MKILNTKRRASMDWRWKSFGIFLLAYGLGNIISFIANPIILPFLNGIGLTSILATVIYGSLTVSVLIFGGLFTFVVLIPLNRYFRVSDK